MRVSEPDHRYSVFVDVAYEVNGPILFCFPALVDTEAKHAHLHMKYGTVP